MSTAQDSGRVYALLADGTTVEIRQARPDDFDAVQAMHEAMAPDNIYLRFFSYSRRSAETEARRICRDPAPGNAALLALLDGELVGVASYAELIGHPGQAEVAFAVADHMHHKGIATLLLEHLVSLARSRQMTEFTAAPLSENRAMLQVFGVAVPPLGLDATFAASRLRPGVAGLMSQSGGVGVALAGQLSRLGIGISSFASVGSKLDVSGNDMLMWWEHDEVTRLAVLYLESFGNPRKFARMARRVGAKMPVLTVRSGHSATDQALFEQAGVIATGSFGELTETAALLATQPVPAGRTVAIVSNVGGAGVLAADACTELGLTVHRPRGLTRRRLRTLLPGGTVTGPVDTTAAVTANEFRRCLELLAADDGVDAMIVLVLPTGATGDLFTAIRDAD